MDMETGTVDDDFLIKAEQERKSRFDDRINQGKNTASRYGLNSRDLLLEMSMDPADRRRMWRSRTNAQLARERALASSKKIRKPETERNTKRKKRRRGKKQTRKRKVSQKGGFCFPCLAPVFAGAGAAIGGASFISKSFSSDSHKTITSGPQGKKEKSSESSEYKQNINGEKSREKISRRGKLVKIGDKKIKTDNLKSAKMLYNKLKREYLN